MIAEIEPERVKKRLRSLYRRHFCPYPPPALDGPIVNLIMAISGCSYLEAIFRRGEENRRRQEKWLRGERWRD